MRLRLTLSFILIALISILIVVVVARQGAANEVRALMYRGGTGDSAGLVASLEDYYRTNGSWVGVNSIFQEGRRGQGLGRGRISGAGGQHLILADSQSNVIFDSENPDPSAALSNMERSSAIQIQVNNQTVGYLLAEGGMGFSREQGQGLIDRLNNAALVAALAAGAISLALALLLTQRLMKPIIELTRAASKLRDGDLSQHVKVRGGDELAVLARSFNEMSDSLQNARESRQAMTADIAHELRNPLAVQRAHLEALQDGIYPANPENLEPVIKQNLLLTRLVEDLRTLAMADSGHLKMDFVRVDLMSLIARVLEGYRPRAQEKDVGLSLEVPCGDITNQCVIAADPIRLEQILGNLLENALRFTPSGGVVHINIIEMEERVQLTVRDDGPGIDNSSLPYIFDRFYRADRSRSRLDGGTGLGLAIARQLARAHGGDLKAGNHPQGGAVFKLELPLGAGV